MTDQLFLDDSSDFAGQFDVSRETLERLRVFANELKKWNSSINLVAKGSLTDLWTRHIADSAQLCQFLESRPESWADFGSGAGLPGAIVALIANEVSPATRFVLVESDSRKAAFLSHAARECRVDLEVISERIEGLTPLKADVISARALASVDRLLGYAEKHLKPGGICLFLKGQGVHKEIQLAQTRWKFEYNLHTSITDPQAAVLEVGAIARV